MVAEAFADLGRELGRLTIRTLRTWWRLLAALLAAMLVGWIGYYGSVLLASIVVFVNVWLVVPCLALGVVIQLTAMIVAMRLAGAEAGVGGTPTTSVPQLLGSTLLPFLCIFSAFGFVNSYASDLMSVTFTRTDVWTLADVLTGLNPVNNLTTALLVLAAIVVLYALRHGVDVVAERLHATWLRLFGAFVEACLVCLTLLTGVRFAGWVRVWWIGREGYAWWRSAVDWLHSVIHIDIPQIVGRIVGAVWPVLWQMLTQPLVWLALTCLVAGMRLTSMEDVLERVGRRAEQRGVAVPSGRASRAVGFHLRETVLGDVDDKVLPSIHALRYIWHAGPGFLGAFVVAFTVVSLLPEVLTRGVYMALGRVEDSFWVVGIPLVRLIELVVVLGLQMVLLSVAFVRAEELVRERADRPETHTRRAHLLGGLAVLVAVAVVATVASVWRNSDNAIARNAAPGELAPIATMRISADSLHLGDAVVQVPYTTATDEVFVVMTVVLECDRACAKVDPTLQAGGRTYEPWDGSLTSFSAEPGFRSTRDAVFEVSRDDLASGRFALTLTAERVYAPAPSVVRVQFTVTPQQVAGAAGVTLEVNDLPIVEVLG